MIGRSAFSAEELVTSVHNAAGNPERPSQTIVDNLQSRFAGVQIYIVGASRIKE
jgi:hypothetical protein